MKNYKVKYYLQDIPQEKRERIGREIFKIIEGQKDDCSYKPRMEIKKGYVYLIGSGDGKFKIGRTSNLVKRLDALQTSHPNPLKVFSFHGVYNPSQVENELHKYFSKKRIHREWFALDQSDIIEFSNIVNKYGMGLEQHPGIIAIDKENQGLCDAMQ